MSDAKAKMLEGLYSTVAISARLLAGMYWIRKCEYGQRSEVIVTLEKVAVAMHCNLRPPDVTPVVLRLLRDYEI